MIGKIPLIGRIFYLKDNKIIENQKVRKQWKKTLFLKESNSELRGWTLAVMNCLDKIDKKEFVLNDLYKYEEYFMTIYPNNKHIKDKIRQQLQFLRDKGYIEFFGNGKYRKVD